MARRKVYYYECRTCHGRFETYDKRQAYCRGCIQAGFAIEGMGPIPTPLQRVKWDWAREAQRLAKEAEGE